MIIYLHGSTDKAPVERHVLICSPAGHLPRDFQLGEKGENGDWWDQTGDAPRPKQFQVEFRFGKAEVPDPLGRYLVGAGLAQKTKLIRPSAWDH